MCLIADRDSLAAHGSNRVNSQSGDLQHILSTQDLIMPPIALRDEDDHELPFFTNTSETVQENHIEDYNLNDIDSDQFESKSYFYPSLYIQRYNHYCDTITRLFGREEIIQIADLGCSEFRIFNHLRHFQNIKKIIAVDIDATKIDLKMIRPQAGDYLCPKLQKMTLEILEGNLRFIDDRLRGLNIISMIEVIEHMELFEVDEILGLIFRIYTPKYVYITTPNRDFNRYFKNMPPNTFRHIGHYFEFTSDEFKKWVERISMKYNYSSEIFGIGTCDDSLDGEYATQGVLFSASQTLRQINSDIKFEENFFLVKKFTFPGKTEQHEELEVAKVALQMKEILYEVSKDYYLNDLDYEIAKEKLSSDGMIKIPLEVIISKIKDKTLDREKLITIILENQIVDYIEEEDCIIHDVNCFFDSDSESDDSKTSLKCS